MRLIHLIVIYQLPFLWLSPLRDLEISTPGTFAVNIFARLQYYFVEILSREPTKEGHTRSYSLVAKVPIFMQLKMRNSFLMYCVIPSGGIYNAYLSNSAIVRLLHLL